MFSRSILARSAPRATAALRSHQSLAICRRRCMATAADTAKYEYETAEAAGVKYANQNIPGLTGSLTVVAKGGSRYQASEGFSEVLEKFAFKSTSKRSQLRITRETELLGGELSASHSRETFLLSARFLNQDLPYFAELFAEVLQDTRYTQHEVDELVLPQVQYNQTAQASSPVSLALNAAHTAAFHAGLGNNVIPALSAPWKKNISAESVSIFAKNLYTKSNLAIIGCGNNTANLGKWINQFFPSLPASGSTGPFTPQPHVASQYYGGEARIPSTAGNALILAFQGSARPSAAAYNPAYAVLAEVLGGSANIKWSSGTSLLSAVKANTPGSVDIVTANNAYADAGLFTITVSGSATSIKLAARPIAETIQTVAEKGVKAEVVQKAIANAKYRAVESASAETVGHDLLFKGEVVPLSKSLESLGQVTGEQIKTAAKQLLKNRATVAAVGDLDLLPYAADIGLQA
ncbi:ubiquinol-cytochrome c reductase core subunit 1 [Ascosphaera aggregata]|nr:ubiquinol-cytochrome c reductase core subunit 1 [Ascosphaera aggregata]